MTNTGPLAQEYAKSTESNLDQGKADDLRSREKRELRRDPAAPASGKSNSSGEEHPISVGKP